MKIRGSLKPTTTVYQLRHAQPKANISFEPLNLHESPPKTLNPSLALLEVENEIHPTTSGVHEGENPLVNLIAIDVPPTLQLDFPTSQSLEEYTIYSDSMPAGSPDYIS
jgi:hypothetical protein